MNRCTAALSQVDHMWGELVLPFILENPKLGLPKGGKGKQLYKWATAVVSSYSFMLGDDKYQASAVVHRPTPPMSVNAFSSCMGNHGHNPILHTFLIACLVHASHAFSCKHLCVPIQTSTRSCTSIPGETVDALAWLSCSRRIIIMARTGQARVSSTQVLCQGVGVCHSCLR